MITVTSIGAISGLEVGVWLSILCAAMAFLYFLARLIWRTATERQQVMGHLKGISKDVKDNKKALDKQTTALESQTAALKAIDDRQSEQATDVAVLKTKVKRAEARLEKLEE